MASSLIINASDEDYNNRRQPSFMTDVDKHSEAFPIHYCDICGFIATIHIFNEYDLCEMCSNDCSEYAMSMGSFDFFSWLVYVERHIFELTGRDEREKVYDTTKSQDGIHVFLSRREDG